VWDHRTGETIPLYRFPDAKNPLPVIPSIEAMKVCPLTGDKNFEAQLHIIVDLTNRTHAKGPPVPSWLPALVSPGGEFDESLPPRKKTGAQIFENDFSQNLQAYSMTGKTRKNIFRNTPSGHEAWAADGTAPQVFCVEIRN
jgi:hypothetical protein